ncbi:MAG: 3'(2'),5'-bisphosphate nucleotidase CysQ [Gammaproteobacteria bacterium]
MSLDGRSLPDAWPAAVRAACLDAGRAILAVRADAAGPGVERKQDGSPVSRADRAASALLRERLCALDPSLPVVCEEGSQDPGDATRFWVVDPLDGTREFLRGSELFTVNVALLDSGRPLFGMIHLPATGECWWGALGHGAWHDGNPVRCAQPAAMPLRILASPSESAADARAFLASLLHRFPDAVLTQLPGALKFCRLAEGLADAYPRSTPSSAWDIAAGQALVEAAGGVVFAADGSALRYRMLPGWPVQEFLALGDATVVGAAARA